MEMVKISSYLTETESKLLRLEAASLERSLASHIRIIIRRHLKSTDRKDALKRLESNLWERFDVEAEPNND